MISSSFVPPEPIRRLRTHTRYRRHLTQARTAEKQRVEKLLEDGHLKLSSVISGIHGVSGRATLDALAAGQRDPTAPAQLARGSMRGKIRRLEDALDCSFFTDQHAAVLAMMLAATGCYTAQAGALTATIEALIAPYLHQVAQPRRRARHRALLIGADDIVVAAQRRARPRSRRTGRAPGQLHRDSGTPVSAGSAHASATASARSAAVNTLGRPPLAFPGGLFDLG